MMKLQKIDTEDMDNELTCGSINQLYLFSVFMYDDTFNLLGIEGGSVHPPHEGTFFVTSDPPQ